MRGDGEERVCGVMHLRVDTAYGPLSPGDGRDKQKRAKVETDEVDHY